MSTQHLILTPNNKLVQASSTMEAALPLSKEELEADLATLEQNDLVRDALSASSSLREYSKQVERDLREVESASVQDYVRQSSQVADLHNEMTKCDGILAKMQEMLLGFETALGSVSSEIRQLQRESVRMSAKLRNRRAAEEKLSAFLESLAFSPEMPAVLCDGEVDDAFLAQVEALDARLAFTATGKACGSTRRTGPSVFRAPKQLKAVAEVYPSLERLKLKACGRSRDYLIETIGELRKMQTNIEMLQRTQLLRFSALFGFLERHAAELAAEVKDFYVDSMSKAHQALFRAYNAALVKFDLEVANKHDLVAVDESAVRSTFTTKVSLTKRGDGFSLGDRADVLSRLDAPPIIAHVAQAEDKRFPFEELFRSAVRHLVDAVANETAFVAAFFCRTAPNHVVPPPGATQKRVDGLVSRIFAKAASAALEHLENKLFQCHDAVGLLLVARIVDAERPEAARFASTLLAKFFNHCDNLLEPRLAAIFASNVDSVKKADPARLGVSGVMPHYVARRYAELAATVLALFPPSDGSAPHAQPARAAVIDLRAQVLDLLQRVAASFKTDKDRHVFLVNNYDHILTIFKERRLDAPEDAKPIELRLKQERDLFVEHQLHACFAKLVDFINHVEDAQLRGAAPGDSPADPSSGPAASPVRLDAALVEKLVRDFAATWRTAIDKIHRDILSLFANFINGKEVLKQVLTQLLLYYTRFQKIIHRAWRRAPPFANDLVPTNVILDEIKQYSHSF